ncbi:unnamed protein product, partial [Clonostachys rhizophaga]
MTRWLFGESSERYFVFHSDYRSPFADLQSSNGKKGLTCIHEQGSDEKYNLYWQAQALFRPCLSGSSILNPVLDTGKPHVNCFVGDNEPLKEDCLSTSEIQSLLWLASEPATDPAYMQHGVFPVTIVSACMFNVRIVEAIVRLGSNTVEIRKSDIMDPSPVLTDESTQSRLLAWLDSPNLLIIVEIVATITAFILFAGQAYDDGPTGTGTLGVL